LLRYAGEELPQRLGLGRCCEAKVTIRRPPVGKVSDIRYADLKGYGRVLLRADYRKKRRRRLAGYAAVAKLMAEHGIDAPRVVFVDDTLSTRRTYRFAVLAEEFVEGTLLGNLPQEARDGLAGSVAGGTVSRPGRRAVKPPPCVRESSAQEQASGTGNTRGRSGWVVGARRLEDGPSSYPVMESQALQGTGALHWKPLCAIRRQAGQLGP